MAVKLLFRAFLRAPSAVVWWRRGLLALVVALVTSVVGAVLDAHRRTTGAVGDISNLVEGRAGFEIRHPQGSFDPHEYRDVLVPLAAHGRLIPRIEVPGALVPEEGDVKPIRIVGATLPELTEGVFLSPAARSVVAGTRSAEHVRLIIHDREVSLAVTEHGPDVAWGGERVALLPAGVLSDILQSTMLSSILFVPHEGSSIEVVGDVVSRGPLFVTTGAERVAAARDLTRAFSENVAIMVALALFVSALVLGNAVQVSLTERLWELSVLATLGASRALRVLLIVSELVVVGIIGVLAAVLLVSPLAETFRDALVTTVTTHYLPTLGGEETNGRLSLRSLLWSCLAAWGVMIAAALPAIRRSGRVVPRLQHRIVDQLVVSHRSHLVRLALGGGGVLLVAGVLSSSGQLLALGVLLVVAGCAPIMLVVTTQMLRNFGWREGWRTTVIAVHGIMSSRQTAELTVMVTGAGIALVVGLATMVMSFRVTLEHWVDDALPAAWYLRPASLDLQGVGAVLSPEIIAQVGEIPGVRLVTRYNDLTRDGMVLAGSDLYLPDGRPRYQLVAGAYQSEKLHAGTGVFISESAVTKLALTVGSTLALPEGEVEVLGVYREFASERPYILFDLDAFSSRFPRMGIRSVGIFVDPERAAVDMRLALTQATRGFAVSVSSAGELREAVFRIFDETFLTTRIMQLVVLLLSGVGIALTLLQFLLERRTDLATLGTLGAGRGLLARAVALEGIIVAVPVVCAGLVGGIVLAGVLVLVVNPQSFGWRLDFIVDWFAVVRMGAIVLIGTLLPCAAIGHFSLIENRRLERIREE